MFSSIYKQFERATIFEKLLLIIGIAVGIVGFWLINDMYVNEPVLTWALIQSMFLWFILIFIIILTDSNESIKEELSIVIKESIEETKLLKEEVKLLKDLAKEQLNEIRLLRKVRKK